MLIEAVRANLDWVALWGLLATTLMTLILEGGQRAGLSRISLPLLFGSFLTGNRSRAMALGFILYLLGGWAFSVLYFLVMFNASYGGPVVGAALGFIHGLFLLVSFLPLLAFIHPRMATDYEGPSDRPRLEPPGVMGLHYGAGTPIITLVAQSGYGAVLGLGFAVN